MPISTPLLVRRSILPSFKIMALRRSFASLQALRRRLRQTRQKKQQQQQQHTSSGMHTTCSKKTLLPARAGRRQELEAAWVPTPILSRVRV